MVGESQQIIAHFQFIGNARCCIRMSYAIPFIVTPYTLWVHMKPKLVKEMKNCKITFFLQEKLMWQDMLLNISEFPVQKYANK